MALLFLIMGCAVPQPCEGPLRDCQAWRSKVDLLEKELTLERIKGARLRSLLELERSRSQPLPRGVSPPGEALGISSSWVSSPFARAYREMLAGNSRAALKDFRAFLQAHPHHPLADDALYYMARLEARLGNKGEALALLERLLKDYPQGDRVSQARLKMGLILMGQGRIKEGEKEIEGVLKASPFVLGEGEAETLLKGEEK